MKPAVLTALKPFNLTTEADVSLLLDPSRHAVCDTGYRIKSGFPDQVCTEVCNRFSLKKLWLLFLSRGELRLRLYFRTVEQCNQSWDVITSVGLNCTNDQPKHGAVSEKLSFKIDVPLETLFSKSATFAKMPPVLNNTSRGCVC